MNLQFAGKSTGIITNTRITHATPAALYGHAPSRYWEDDSKVPPSSRKSCKDLARQLIEDDPGRNINVSIQLNQTVKLLFTLRKHGTLNEDYSIAAHCLGFQHVGVIYNIFNMLRYVILGSMAWNRLVQLQC